MTKVPELEDKWRHIQGPSMTWYWESGAFQRDHGNTAVLWSSLLGVLSTWQQQKQSSSPSFYELAFQIVQDLRSRIIGIPQLIGDHWTGCSGGLLWYPRTPFFQMRCSTSWDQSQLWRGSKAWMVFCRSSWSRLTLCDLSSLVEFSAGWMPAFIMRFETMVVRTACVTIHRFLAATTLVKETIPVQRDFASQFTVCSSVISTAERENCLVVRRTLRAPPSSTCRSPGCV